MAHLNAGQMKTMVSREMVTGTDMPEMGKLDFCEACAEGKFHQTPFKPVGEVQSKKRSFWAEAVCSAAYIRNRVITTATGVTPYERWYGKKPDVSNFRVFGCIAYAHVPDC